MSVCSFGGGGVDGGGGSCLPGSLFVITTLIKAIDDWKVSLDRNQVVGAVFMDLSKAFDCLPHGLLIVKFHAYGLSLNACDLFSSYLCNRFQKVKVKNNMSEWVVVRNAIPRDLFLDL